MGDVNCAYKRDFLCQRNQKEEPQSKGKHCDLNVLSVDHKWADEGTYFNFDKKELDEILGRTDWSNERLEIGNGMKLVVWRNPNGGSKGDAHGRKDPYQTAKANDWSIGDKIKLKDCGGKPHNRPPAPKPKGWPSAKPKPCPSDSPTAKPTTWPTTATLEPTPQTTSSFRTARPTILPPTSGRPTTPPTTLEPTPSTFDPTATPTRKPTPKPTPCGDAVCGIDEFCCTLGCSPRCLPIGRRCVAGC